MSATLNGLGARLIRTGLFAAGLVAIAPAGAETTIALQDGGSVSLGSGVNLLNPNGSKPACFTFDQVDVDPNVPLSYRYSIDAFASTDELRRAMRVAGAVGASGMTMSGKVSGWRQRERSESKSALYVLIDAWFEGPRKRIQNVKALPEVSELLTHGSVGQAISRCGTHIATMAHHRQALRLVLNLSSLDSRSKQEIFAKVSAKGKFGFGGASMSAQTNSSVQRAATENRASVEIAGNGAPPDPDKVFALIGEKGGDLTAIATALKGLFPQGTLAAQGSYAPYKYTVHSLSDYAPALVNLPAVGAGIGRLQDQEDIAVAELADLKDSLAVGGISSARREELLSRRNSTAEMLVRLRDDLKKCVEGVGMMAESCDDAARTYESEMTSRHFGSATIGKVEGPKRGVVINASSVYPSRSTILIELDGAIHGLDVVRLVPGSNKVWLAREQAAGTGVSELPVLFLAMQAISAVNEMPKAVSAQGLIQISCNSFSFNGAGGTAHAFGSITTAMKVQAHAESPCSNEGQPMGGQLGGLAGGMTLGQLFPPMEPIVRMQVPKGKARLLLSSVNIYGVSSVSMLSEDVEELFAEANR